MSLSSDNTVMTMPVTPAYQGGGYGNSMWGGDWASWIILFHVSYTHLDVYKRQHLGVRVLHTRKIQLLNADT